MGVVVISEHQIARLVAIGEEWMSQDGRADLDDFIIDIATNPAIPISEISKILTDAMDTACANGADSRSMPDEYVAVAAWLCGIPPKENQND